MIFQIDFRLYVRHHKVCSIKLFYFNFGIELVLNPLNWTDLLEPSHGSFIQYPHGTEWGFTVPEFKKKLLWDKKPITADFKMRVPIWNWKEIFKIRVRTEIKKKYEKRQILYSFKLIWNLSFINCDKNINLGIYSIYKIIYAQCFQKFATLEML